MKNSIFAINYNYDDNVKERLKDIDFNLFINEWNRIDIDDKSNRITFTLNKSAFDKIYKSFLDGYSDYEVKKKIKNDLGKAFNLCMKEEALFYLYRNKDNKCFMLDSFDTKDGSKIFSLIIELSKEIIEKIDNSNYSIKKTLSKIIAESMLQELNIEYTDTTIDCFSKEIWNNFCISKSARDETINLSFFK